MCAILLSVVLDRATPARVKCAVRHAVKVILRRTRERTIEKTIHTYKYMLSSKYGFGQSMDCLLNPRIEHAQSTDWGNPWIGVLIKGWYPLWLNRGGLLVRNTE